MPAPAVPVTTSPTSVPRNRNVTFRKEGKERTSESKLEVVHYEEETLPAASTFNIEGTLSSILPRERVSSNISSETNDVVVGTRKTTHDMEENEQCVESDGDSDTVRIIEAPGVQQRMPAEADFVAANSGRINSQSVSHDLKWETMFRRLVEYKAEHGDCLVPNRYKEDTKLGSWVSTQRRQYKAIKMGKAHATTLPGERIDRLDAIGFAWETSDPRRVEWEARYSQLCEFRRIHGNAMVPMGYEENVALANWVSVQRQEYKNLLLRKPTKMTSERIRLLEAVDFIWKAPRGARRKHYPDDPSRRNPFINKKTSRRHPAPAGQSDSPSEDDDTASEELDIEQQETTQLLRSESPSLAVRSTIIAIPDVPASNQQAADSYQKDTGAARNGYANQSAVPLQLGGLGGVLGGSLIPHSFGYPFPQLGFARQNLAGMAMMGASPYQQLLASSTAAAAFAAEAQLYQRAVALMALPPESLPPQNSAFMDFQGLSGVGAGSRLPSSSYHARSVVTGNDEYLRRMNRSMSNPREKEVDTTDQPSQEERSKDDKIIPSKVQSSSYERGMGRIAGDGYRRNSNQHVSRPAKGKARKGHSSSFEEEEDGKGES